MQLIIKFRTQAGNQTFNDSLLCEESLFSPDQTAVVFPDTNLLDFSKLQLPRDCNFSVKEV